MSILSKEAAIAALNGVRDPATGRGLHEAGLIQGLVVKGDHIAFMIEVSPAVAERYAYVRDAAESAVRGLRGVQSVTAVLTAHGEQMTARTTATPAPRGQTIPGVKAIVAVASGKGGVGKSTVAVNLALSLTRMGLRAGLMDADVYGPSVPQLLGLTGRPESDGKMLRPMERYDLKAMSIGLLLDRDAPAVWRGPVATGALNQLLTQVAWGELDVLLIDMPPGTGDIHLSVAQRVALAGAVIVSTPQDIALLDARRGIAMFRKVEVPIMGIVENMSTYVCPNCGHEAHLFGHGGARATAVELGAAFLGEIPLHLSIREGSDNGAPVAVSAPEGPQAKAFMAIAELVAAQLDSGPANRPTPKIVFV